MYKNRIIIISILLMAVFSAFVFDSIKASWYGGKHHGRRTASGMKFDKNKMTCAASSQYNLFDTLEVTNDANGKKVVVVVTDRGGFFKYGRTLDLSEGAFSKIADTRDGVINITIKKIGGKE